MSHESQVATPWYDLAEEILPDLDHFTKKDLFWYFFQISAVMQLFPGGWVIIPIIILVMFFFTACDPSNEADLRLVPHMAFSSLVLFYIPGYAFLALLEFWHPHR